MNGRYFIGRILLTVLLAFCMAGYIVSSAAAVLISKPGIYTDIIRDEKLADKVYSALESDFKEQYNTTAIPAEVYMDAITTEWLEEEMCSRTEMYLERISGDKVDYVTDFTALEESITSFFYEYAESIDYEPDEAFDEKLSETIAKAEEKTEQRMDAFYMRTMEKNGIIAKLQRYAPYLKAFNWGIWGLAMALFIVLVILERNRNWRRIYWSGTGLFCGSALAAIPCIYLLATNAVQRFSVKDPIVYTAVTKLLETGIWQLLIKAIIYGVLGIAMIVICVILNKKVIADKSES